MSQVKSYCENCHRITSQTVPGYTCEECGKSSSPGGGEAAIRRLGDWIIVRPHATCLRSLSGGEFVDAVAGNHHAALGTGGQPAIDAMAVAAGQTCRRTVLVTLKELLLDYQFTRPLSCA